jgi:hypothetical protein
LRRLSIVAPLIYSRFKEFSKKQGNTSIWDCEPDDLLATAIWELTHQCSEACGALSGSGEATAPQTVEATESEVADEVNDLNPENGNGSDGETVW